MRVLVRVEVRRRDAGGDDLPHLRRQFVVDPNLPFRDRQQQLRTPSAERCGP